MKKILSVDDSAIIRKIVHAAVDRLGYDFLEAADGQQAMDVMAANYQDVELILLDWNMPNKDGFQTLEELKADSRYAPIPVMMLTTESERTNVIRAIKAGAKNYLTKPFNQEDLVVRMMECIGMC